MRIPDLMALDLDECKAATEQVYEESSGYVEMIDNMGSAYILAYNLRRIHRDCVEANPESEGALVAALLMAFAIGATYAERRHGGKEATP